jgi:ribosomal protein S13
MKIEVEDVVEYSKGLRRELRWEDLEEAQADRVEYKPIDTHLTRLYNSPLWGRVITTDLDDQSEKRMAAQERELRFQRMSHESDMPVDTQRALHEASRRRSENRGTEGPAGPPGAPGPAGVPGPAPDMGAFREMLSTSAEEQRRPNKRESQRAMYSSWM